MAEEWRSVVGYEGWYEVSNLGRIRNVKKRQGTVVGRMMSPSTNRHGYSYVCLRQDNEQKTALVHRGVMAAFVGPCPDGLETNHKDGIKGNCQRSNLEYTTSSENQRHAYRLGLKTPWDERGEKNPYAKLTESKIHNIRRRLKHETQTAIAKSVGMSRAAIGLIANGKTWGWLEEEPV